MADVWLGAAITAALFELGKLVIGFYVGKLALASTYGGLARDPVDLRLVHLADRAPSAEFTHCYARRYRRREPASTAVFDRAA